MLATAHVQVSSQALDVVVQRLYEKIKLKVVDTDADFPPAIPDKEWPHIREVCPAEMKLDSLHCSSNICSRCCLSVKLQLTLLEEYLMQITNSHFQPVNAVELCVRLVTGVADTVFCAFRAAGIVNPNAGGEVNPLVWHTVCTHTRTQVNERVSVPAYPLRPVLPPL